MSQWSDSDGRSDLTELEAELKPVLQSVMVSAPSSHETQQLLDSLIPVLDDKDDRDHVWQQHQWHKTRSLWRQLKTQAKLYGWAFWAASFVCFCLITFTMQSEFGLPAAGEISPLFQLAPLILFVSLLYSYRTWDRGMRMVESVTVFPPALLVLCRFLVVLVLDMALTLLSSVYLLLFADPYGRAPEPLLFILYALAPLAFLFGVIACTMLYKGIWPGMGVGFVCWLLGLISPITEWLYTPPVMIVILSVGVYLSIFAYRKGKVVQRVAVS